MILLALLLGLSSTVARSQAVLGDAQLIEWSRDTYTRRDWLYAALHMNALIQRNPAALRNNPDLAREIAKGLDYAIKQLQEAQRLAEAYREARRTSAGSGGVAGIQSGLSTTPPTIRWPR